MRFIKLLVPALLTLGVLANCSDTSDSHILIILNASNSDVRDVEAKMDETILKAGKLIPGGRTNAKYTPKNKGGLSVSWTDPDGIKQLEEFSYVNPSIRTVEVFVIGCDALRASETVLIE